MTGKEAFLNNLKNMSPVSYLLYLGSSIPISKIEESIADIQRIGLPDEVINVISDYVMRKNNNRFSLSYAEMIAETLKSRKTSTAEDALRFFSMIQRKKKSEDQGEQLDPIPAEEMAEFLGDIIYQDPLVLHPTKIEENELKKYLEGIPGDITKPLSDREIKDLDEFTTTWKEKVRESSKKRIEKEKKRYIQEFINTHGGPNQDACQV